ncbi:hypothetical protein BC670_3393 [Flavobacterium branchiophilum]|uniref:Uncharacterized protein n=1 Tax=Flavobacterium branchiophilum TaxID=55197 RepID=A0A543G8D2_9FLAO|nr:hypothetical protein BC670_3393 [Flavobacterium branchiophilum]
MVFLTLEFVLILLLEIGKIGLKQRIEVLFFGNWVVNIDNWVQ